MAINFRKLSLIILAVIYYPLQAQITFIKWYGGPNDDEGYGVEETIDGGYIIGGLTTSSAGFSDMYLIKTNSLGDTLWSKIYGGDSFDGIYSMVKIANGYLLAGFTNSFGNGLHDVYLVRTDLEGNAVWTKTYGGSGYDAALGVKGTVDDGFIITGYTDEGMGGGDVYLIKVDSLGDSLWTKTYGGTEYDVGTSVSQTNDLGYIIVGTTLSYGAGFDDI
ncbi:MAG: hypothetical protein ACPL28_08000, partial [bacterium]